MVGVLSTVMFLWSPPGWMRAIEQHWGGMQETSRVWAGSETKAPVTLSVSESAAATQFRWDGEDTSSPEATPRRFLTISWDAEENLVSGATSAMLEIQDGAERSEFPIELSRLVHGSRTYVPESEEISFHLVVSRDNGEPAVATARFSSPQVTPSP